MNKGLVRGISLLSIIVATSATYGGAQQAPAIGQVTFTESAEVRRMTRSEGTGTSTWEASHGKAEIYALIPLTPEKKRSLNANSNFSLQIGGFNLSGTLNDDPNYRAGKTNARIVQKQSTSSGQSEVVVASINFDWKANALIINAEGRLPKVQPIGVSDFADELGEFDAETKASVSLGEIKTERVVRYKAQVKRSTSEVGNTVTETVSVDLRALLDLRSHKGQ